MSSKSRPASASGSSGNRGGPAASSSSSSGGALTPAQKRRLRKKKLEEKNAEERGEGGNASTTASGAPSSPSSASPPPSPKVRPAAAATSSKKRSRDEPEQPAFIPNSKREAEQSQSDESDNEDGNIITPANAAAKRSIAALSAKQVLKAAEEERKKAASLLGESDSEGDSDDGKKEKAKKSKVAQDSKKSKKSSGDDELTINKAYAKKFEEEKRKQTLSRRGSRGDSLSTLLREAANASDSDLDIDSGDELLADVKSTLRGRDSSAAGDDDDEDSDSSEDSEGELLTSAVNKKISATLEAIRSKNPEVYDSNKRFFHPDEIEQNKQPKSSSKKLNVTQVMAAQILNKKDPLSKGSDSDADSSSDDEGNTRSRLQSLSNKSGAALTYSQQQQKIKQDFLDSVNKKKKKAGSDDDDDESDEEVFKVKKKAKAASSDDEEDVAPSKSKLNLNGKGVTAENAGAFLNEYLSGQWWKEKDLSKLPTYKDIKGEDLPDEVSASEDEAALDDADTYEEAYNFRFQEPNNAYQIQSYPRPQMIQDSLRRDDSKRKQARETAKKHKEEEKIRKKEEIKRLKAEKRKEITSKVKELESIAGLKDSSAKLNINDLLNNWDPAKHDEMMAQLFDQDDYYADMADADLDEEELRRQALEGEDMTSLGMGKLPSAGHKKSKMDAATSEKVDSLSSELKKKVDDLQQLDYEDLIGTGNDLAPTRFKYRQVEPDTFGFTLQELLELPDSVLNSRVSLKKYAAYRGKEEAEEQMPHKKKRDEKMAKFHQKAQKKDQWKKQHPTQASHKKESKPFTPAPSSSSAADDSSSTPAGPLSAAQKRRQRKKKLEQMTKSATEPSDNSEPPQKKQKV